MRTDIQGLRAVAVLAVIAYHAGLPADSGFVGVDVFFVISGFVITSMLQSQLAATGRVRYRTFFARRVRRLLPALAVMIVATAAAAVFVLPLQDQAASARTGAAASVFVANMQLYVSTGDYFALASDANAFLHTWSLSVEEQFYLFFPLVLVVGWRLARTRGSVMAVIAVMAASFALSIGLATGVVADSIVGPGRLAFYSAPTRAWEFAVGAALALLWPQVRAYRASMSAVVVDVVNLVGAAVLVVSIVAITSTSVFPGWVAVWPVLGAALTISTADVSNSAPARLLRSRPMAAIGSLSYSLYLWHWPLLVLFRSKFPDASIVETTLVALASSLPAYASYRWLETPLRTGQSRLAASPVGLAAVCVVVPAAVCVFVAHQSGEAWGSDRLLRWESLRVAESASAARGCHTSAPISWGECTWNDDGRQSVVLLGDSHASALSDAMIESASAMDYRVVVRSASNCPFLADGFQWTTNGDQGHIRACREFVERQLTSLRSDPPDVLVIANRATNRTNPPVLTDQETPLAVCPVFARGEICPSQAELGRAWAQSLEKTLDLISALGTRVLIVHTVPDHRVHLGSCSFTTGLDVDCTRTEREFVDTRRGGVVALEREVVARFAPAASWDAAPAFCDDGWCERRVDGAPAYRDEQHLSPHGARLLQPDLGEAVTALLRRD